ncbi:nitrite reductase small subunit NirD [Aquipseudomonas alcaligenes]|uniref:Nitrite reductase small subunit n=1 Tax=Aquipseudomonas alcaligenes (strain ATCC 14909 / DSM 50342 / CCUG 1425 / JCM 20561 / NBRC 14159 / NCIMB 9945 / NCTC 10367 / 1577) TaxID=1215092 RepID=U2ZUV4_AQUA1|nr:nitrite reductase small subunit NirD [Pseudomonas alcaligenes]GAD64842.1 nitrite reductase small subunit [Pseudomonas alcaligenes NBRC 14159]SUD17640.1 nitrite reductase [NAD(P)H] small subunit [Pseudomonas alcaligenes]
MNIALNLKCNWQPLCSTADLVANSGVVALLEGQQVALFYLPENEQQVFAIGNCDPKSGANVIGRGIVGHLQGELVIASPLYKQHYRLRDGGCLEYPELNLPAWPVRLNGEQVEVALS